MIDPAQADFVLNTGPDAELGEEEIDPYLPLLEQCVAHGLPMICANPDQQVIRGSQRLICAGPWQAGMKAATAPCAGLASPTRKSTASPLRCSICRARVLALGDALATDMRGAATVGIDGCWVLGGIHQEMLGGSWEHGRNPDYDLAVAEAGAAGLGPVACVPSLRW